VAGGAEGGGRGVGVELPVNLLVNPPKKRALLASLAL
jgi:hypothetical protein